MQDNILAVMLAREAFFGDGILKCCTPRGWNELRLLSRKSTYGSWTRCFVYVELRQLLKREPAPRVVDHAR